MGWNLHATLTVGFLVMGPLSGYLSDRHGARAFSTGGMLLNGGRFHRADVLPANFTYIIFAGCS